MSFFFGGARQEMKQQTERILSEMKVLERTFKGNTRMFRRVLKNVGLVPDDLRRDLKSNLQEIARSEEMLVKALMDHTELLRRLASEL